MRTPQQRAQEATQLCAACGTVRRIPSRGRRVRSRGGCAARPRCRSSASQCNLLDLPAGAANGVMVMRRRADDVCRLTALVDARTRLALGLEQIKRAVNGRKRDLGARLFQQAHRSRRQTDSGAPCAKSAAICSLGRVEYWVRMPRNLRTVRRIILKLRFPTISFDRGYCRARIITRVALAATIAFMCHPEVSKDPERSRGARQQKWGCRLSW